MLEAFGSARHSFNATLNEYKKLGYKVAEENNGAVEKNNNSGGKDLKC